jgi:hypothetical protein
LRCEHSRLICQRSRLRLLKRQSQRECGVTTLSQGRDSSQRRNQQPKEESHPAYLHPQITSPTALRFRSAGVVLQQRHQWLVRFPTSFVSPVSSINGL